LRKQYHHQINRLISDLAAIMNSRPMDFDLGVFNRHFYSNRSRVRKDS